MYLPTLALAIVLTGGHLATTNEKFVTRLAERSTEETKWHTIIWFNLPTLALAVPLAFWH